MLGDARSGKSTFLRTVAHEVMHRQAAEAQLFVVDLRRALLGEVPDEYLAGYLTTREQAASELAGLADYLRQRPPPTM